MRIQHSQLHLPIISVSTSSLPPFIMKFLTAIVTIAFLLTTPVVSDCVVPEGTAYWYTLTSDQSTAWKDTGKTYSGAQNFCPPARKCYGGQTSRIDRLDFDGENVQCIIFNQADCKGDIKREVTKPEKDMIGVDFLWYEWRSFFCWDMRLGILNGRVVEG